MSVGEITAGGSRFYVTDIAADDIASGVGDEWRVVTLDGARMKTKDALMATFADALDFPDHFGANWDALNDSLSELAWDDESRLLLVFDDADDVLGAAPGERGTLFAVLAHAFDDAEDEEDTELRVALVSADPDGSRVAAAARAAGLDVAVCR